VRNETIASRVVLAIALGACTGSPVSAETAAWPRHIIDASSRGAGGVRLADVNGDGLLDITYSCEHAEGDKRGVVWLKQVPGADGPQWVTHDLSGPDGIKFDHIELMDVDSDGDLDLLTCEERHRSKENPKLTGLGVFWYENP